MKKICFLICIIVSLLIIYNVTLAKDFFDVLDDHWAYKYIDELSDKNIINGYEDGSYRPNGTITRSEFLKLVIMTCLDEKVDITTAKGKIDSWSKDYVQIASNYKVIEENEFTEKTVNNPITRAEMARLVALAEINMLKFEKSNSNVDFEDIDTLSKDNIELLAFCTSNGIIYGYEDNTFKPNNKMTRAEAAAIIYRMLKKNNGIDKVKSVVPNDGTNDNTNTKDNDKSEIDEPERYSYIPPSKKQYEISFYNDDGSLLFKKTYYKGATPSYEGETPEKQSTILYDYTFEGWNHEITKVEGTKKYTAVFSEHKIERKILGLDDIEHGTVTAEMDDQNVVTFHISADDGYELKSFIVRDEDGNEIEITEESEELIFTNGTIPSDITVEVVFKQLKDKLNESIANAPILGVGMKAVSWEDDEGTDEVVEDEFSEDMYSYVMGDGITDSKDSKWANAITEDGSYWVWIPRFAYKVIYYTDETKEEVASGEKTQFGDIDILFMYEDSNDKYRNEDGKARSLPSGYVVHPAFQKMSQDDVDDLNPLGKWDEELQGVWIAKYESSRETSEDGNTWESASSSDTLTTNAGNKDATMSRIVSKPSVSSWRTIREGYIYQNGLAYDKPLNSHEVKNSEWGAAAYLAHSAFGRNGNEVAVNQCSNHYTGGGPGEGESTVYNSQYSYSSSTFDDTYAWNTEQGMLASTTGNIYGVYDMAGGGYEYTASFINNGSSTITSDSRGGALGTIPNNPTLEDLRTRQVYPSTVSDASDSKEADYALLEDVYGDAIYETSLTYEGNNAWYNDTSNYLNSNSPFFIRGGGYTTGEGSGLFYFYNYGGSGYNNRGFRLALAFTDEFKVVFEPNGDDVTGSMDDQIIAFGKTEQLSTNEFEREGYIFKGWALSSKGEVEFEDEAEYTASGAGELVLYAIWEIDRSCPLSKPNEPILTRNMRAVWWDDDDASTEYTADKFRDEMYEYVKGDGVTDSKDSKWANGITEDGSYWVWIPRYAYRITYYEDEEKTTLSTEKTRYGDIDVLFMYDDSSTKYRDENGKAKDLPDGFILHPAFEKMTDEDVENLNPLGKWDEELCGIWVAKYEAGMETRVSGEEWVSESGTDVLTTLAGNTDEVEIRLVSKPSIKSWRKISQNYIYQNSLALDPEFNSHEMKNSEWGAAAYLAYSPYGRNGNELAVNQCSNFYTGAGPGIGNSDIYNSTYTYNANNFEDTYAWNTEQGKLASTTGNIYGVYDMSGGAYEYMASFGNNGHPYITSPERGGELGNLPDNPTMEDLRTRQVYKSSVDDGSESSEADYNLLVNNYGDGVYEVSVDYSGTNAWCGDSSNFMYGADPFFLRGGSYSSSSRAGLFYLFNYGGSAYNDRSYRPVMVTPLVKED